MQLPFTGPWLLAPMEGVTEPCFRDLVLARNPPHQLGGAFTEFVRVVDHTMSRRVLREHLGPLRFEAPVGLQVMGANLESLEATAARAVEVGAPLVDINFGCPAKGALRGCAGSAVLRDPRQLETIVATCVRGVAGAVPVTAKIRAGDRDADHIEEIARAAENGGADLLTVHCRTRQELYCDEVDWSRIARASNAVSIPVCGNGGVRSHLDLARMRAETGCKFVMVGRAALGDPWIFSGQVVGRGQAARFLLEYADLLEIRQGMSAKGRAGRVKQLLRHWVAGGLVNGARQAWLADRDPISLFNRLREAANPSEPELLSRRG